MTGAAEYHAHNRRIAGMLDDPDCVGELLLVGIGMARSLDLGDPPFDDQLPTAAIAERIYGKRRLPGGIVGVPIPSARGNTDPRRRIGDVFFFDRRRYDPDFDPGARAYHAVACGRPMIRRDGLCDREASSRERLTDPVSGRRQWVGACTATACKAWLAALTARNSAALAESPPPHPPANAGGVLERHLPEIDWWAVWSHVDDLWRPPVEGVTLERPRLRLVVADLGDIEVSEPRRPALRKLDGGWR